MSQTSNPHRGFDYATTVVGEAVPTFHDRNLARRLSDLDSVETVGWSGTRACVSVRTTSMQAVMTVAGEMFDDREADIRVAGDSDDRDELTKLLIQPER